MEKQNKLIKVLRRLLNASWVALILFFMGSCSIDFFGFGNSTLPENNIDIPHQRTINWSDSSEFYGRILNMWSKLTIQPGNSQWKVNNPRILLAQLHSKTDLSKTNQLILNAKPWGVSGSSWSQNENGDYDFTITVLTTILWQFGDNPDILYPKTVEHLLNILLTEHGGDFRYAVPNTLGLYPETENHILMTEGSRYLKNRWLNLHGDDDDTYDNVDNGMEEKILEFLYEMKDEGLVEFNSMPYVGYTISALLNLEAFASESVRKVAREVLDYMNYCYALGSYNYKFFPPMRRRYDNADFTALTTGYHSVCMKAWMSFYPGLETNFEIGKGRAHALMAACMPYRPADEITKLLFEKEDGYFVKIGHGKKSCPEIYSAGKNFLLSAGGANRGEKSEIVARPIVLLMNDDAKILSETFHLYGPGSDFMAWNNTGVYKNFACAAGPVNVPKGYNKPILKDGSWSIYIPCEKLVLAVYSTADLGIIAVFEDIDHHNVFNELVALNQDDELLKTQFKFPGIDGCLIEYDGNAPEDNWVIKSIDGKSVHREYDKWPLINGNFK